MPTPLHIAFIWHMHQPYYRDLASGTCSMPWVRLHGTKDYLDMVKRLKRFPNIHQTFNLVPSLLDQIEEYLPPQGLSDTFLDVSRKQAAELTEDDKKFILKWFFLVNIDRMVKPHVRYHDLMMKRGKDMQDGNWASIFKRFKTQDYLDLQVWFNLSWIDPWLCSEDAKLSAIKHKAKHFSEEEKAYVLDFHLELLSQIIPAYKEAQARGQIEISTTPYYHPILPLLCDSKAALAAMPHVTLPTPRFQAQDDARWQIEKALLRHQRAFDATPGGMWPSEGSVSEEVVQLALAAGIRWIATDEEILWRSIKSGRSNELLYQPHFIQRKDQQLAVVFRDRQLSDLIGFVYSQWDASAAVSDFMSRLTHIYEQQKNGHPKLISIILDGENAWEFYENDAHDFFEKLYGALNSDERFRCVTVSQFLNDPACKTSATLPTLFSGSWIDGNFATWIGHEEKNAAWSHLARARAALADKRREDPAYTKAWRSFGIAEGSDWMWWFGDTHFTAQADEFDRLFRQHLTNTYRFANLEVPTDLEVPIRRHAVHALQMPTGLIQPAIDGQDSSYYEWLYAGSVDLRQQYGAIQRAEQYLRVLRYGLSRQDLFIRCDFDLRFRAQTPRWKLRLAFSKEVGLLITHAQSKTSAELKGAKQPEVACAFDHILELQVPLSAVNPTGTDHLNLSVELLIEEQSIECYPSEGSFLLVGSPGVLERLAWPV